MEKKKKKKKLDVKNLILAFPIKNDTIDKFIIKDNNRSDEKYDNFYEKKIVFRHKLIRFKFLENIIIIEKDLVSIFEKNGIKKIDAQNNKFDPNIHQAMSEIEDEKAEAGTVLQEIQAGYMIGERLLRPALVSVSKKKTSENQENKEKKEEK